MRTRARGKEQKGKSTKEKPCKIYIFQKEIQRKSTYNTMTIRKKELRLFQLILSILTQ